MGAKKVSKRSKVKPFIKTVNYNHIMPTRYTLELEGLKNVVSNDTFKEVSQREEAKKVVKKALEERYTSGKNRWFFTALRMFCSVVLPLCCDNRRGANGYSSRFLNLSSFPPFSLHTFPGLCLAVMKVRGSHA